MIDYVKRLFKKPTEIYTARNMKNSHYFLFILLMGIVMTFFSIFTMKPEFEQLTSDYNEVQSFIPDFELREGKLISEDKSYIYQTDNIIFYFDPQNKIDSELIDKNMRFQSAPIAIGLLNQEIYFNITDFKQSLSYSDLNFTTDNLKESMSLKNFSNPLFYSLFLIILFVFNLFLYLTQLLSISIFANLISVIERTGLKFFQNAKIALLASMIPFLFISIANAFQLPISYPYEIVSFASLVLFYMSIREFKNRLKEHTKPEK